MHFLKSCYLSLFLETSSTELALQRIEAQTGLTLSRAIATPNIASKGKLAPRSVLIPTALLPGAPRTAQRTEAHPAAMDMDIADSGGAPSGKGKQRGGAPLIEEISPSRAGAKPSTTSTALPGLKGILKKPVSASPSASPTALRGADAGMDVDVDESAPLEWDWTATEKDKGGKTRLKITVRVPGLVSFFFHRVSHFCFFFLRTFFCFSFHQEAEWEAEWTSCIHGYVMQEGARLLLLLIAAALSTPRSTRLQTTIIL
jgi:hypothetical protein